MTRGGRKVRRGVWNRLRWLAQKLEGGPQFAGRCETSRSRGARSTCTEQLFGFIATLLGACLDRGGKRTGFAFFSNFGPRGRALAVESGRDLKSSRWLGWKFWRQTRPPQRQRRFESSRGASFGAATEVSAAGCAKAFSTYGLSSFSRRKRLIHWLWAGGKCKVGHGGAAAFTDAKGRKKHPPPPPAAVVRGESSWGPPAFILSIIHRPNRNRPPPRRYRSRVPSVKNPRDPTKTFPKTNLASTVCRGWA